MWNRKKSRFQNRMTLFCSNSTVLRKSYQLTYPERVLGAVMALVTLAPGILVPLSKVQP